MQTSLQNALVIALGGAVGALARYALGLLAMGRVSERFPWGTLAVNLLGCFAIGLAMWAFAQRGAESDDRVRLLIATGFLGSFTTFSAFGYETLTLLRAGQGGLALANVLANVVLGIVLVAIGWLVGRWLLGEVPA